MAPLTPPVRGSRLLAGSIALTVLGAAGVLAGTRVAASRTAYAYLTAYSFAVSVAVGALLLLLLGYAINAVWMSVIRRLTEAITLALVPLALLFVPVALSARELYVWTLPEAPMSRTLAHVVHHHHAYLNLPFFVGRAGLYFAIWIVPALLLRRWSARRPKQDAGDPLDALARERGLSAGMLMPVVLAMTFCAFDWLMSLEPTWSSSVYGLYYLTGGSLAAIAAVTLLAHLAARAGLLEDVITPHHFHALGRLLFVFTILWAYLAYFQVFLISIADEPREVSFYLARARGSWKLLGPVLAVGHFGVPVLLLSPRRWKYYGGFLACLSAWLLVMHYADLYLLVMPVQRRESALPHWVDLAGLLAVGGACVAFCAWRQRGRPLIAVNDPLLARGAAYRSPS